MIKDLKENKIIYQSSINEEIVQELIDNSYNFDTAFYIITENNMYKDNRNNQCQKEFQYKNYIKKGRGICFTQIPRQQLSTAPTPQTCGVCRNHLR